MGLFDKFAARKALLKHSKGETEEAYKEYGELFEAGKMVDAKYLLPYSILLMRHAADQLRRLLLEAGTQGLCAGTDGRSAPQESQRQQLRDAWLSAR